MTPEFRESIRRGMQRYQQQGITCRLPTEEEREAERVAAAKEQYGQVKKRIARGKRKGRYKGCREGAKPFADRVKDMKEVRRIAEEQNITIRDACDVVGISFSNYRSVKAAHAKGLTKRP